MSILSTEQEQHALTLIQAGLFDNCVNQLFTSRWKFPHKRGSIGYERFIAATGYARQNTFTCPELGEILGIDYTTAKKLVDLWKSKDLVSTDTKPGPGKVNAWRFNWNPNFNPDIVRK